MTQFYIYFPTLPSSIGTVPERRKTHPWYGQRDFL